MLVLLVPFMFSIFNFISTYQHVHDQGSLEYHFQLKQLWQYYILHFSNFLYLPLIKTQLHWWKSKRSLKTITVIFSIKKPSKVFLLSLAFSCNGGIFILTRLIDFIRIQCNYIWKWQSKFKCQAESVEYLSSNTGHCTGEPGVP